MSTATSTQIQLAARPVGWPTHDDFRVVTVDYADPAPGEVRVKNAISTFLFQLSELQ